MEDMEEFKAAVGRIAARYFEVSGVTEICLGLMVSGHMDREPTLTEINSWEAAYQVEFPGYMIDTNPKSENETLWYVYVTIEKYGNEAADQIDLT